MFQFSLPVCIPPLVAGCVLPGVLPVPVLGQHAAAEGPGPRHPAPPAGQGAAGRGAGPAAAVQTLLLLLRAQRGALPAPALVL